MKFLVDECLSLDLVTAANDVGYEAQHVVRIGKAGWMDWNVTAYASEGDFTLVTNNDREANPAQQHPLLHHGMGHDPQPRPHRSRALSSNDPRL